MARLGALDSSHTPTLGFLALTLVLQSVVIVVVSAVLASPVTTLTSNNK